jgi:hypothetical protein
MTTLDPYQIKQLLQDVEAKNLPRKEIVFLPICNEDIRLYGPKGTELRRNFQTKFDYVKKWRIRKYVDYLEEHGVAVSITTQRLLHTEPDDAPIDDDDEAANPTNPTSTDKDWDDAAAMEDAFSGLLMNAKLLEDDYYDLEKNGEGIFSTPECKTRTPNRSTSKKVRTPLRTPNRSPIPPSPPYFRSPSLVESSISSVSSAGEPRREDGTKKNPCVMFVDPTCPERNREFDIERVCKIKHNGYEYNGYYHVRTPIAVPDYNNWEAHVPTELPRHSHENTSGGPYW